MGVAATQDSIFDWREVGAQVTRHHQRHRRQSDRDCRRLHRRRATTHTQARRPHPLILESPARRGWECHPGRRLGEEPFHTLFVGCDVRIHLAIGSLKIRIRDQPAASVPWTCDVDHVQVVLLDQPVQVDIDEVQTRSGPQCPRRRGLMCSLVKVFFSSGLS